MRHDRMMWQLTLVRERQNKDTGATEFYSVPDTAANRNQGRFAKMPKARDTKFSSHGGGVVHTPPPPKSRHAIARLEINRVSRDLVSSAQCAPDDCPIVTPPASRTVKIRYAKAYKTLRTNLWR